MGPTQQGAPSCPTIGQLTETTAAHHHSQACFPERVSFTLLVQGQPEVDRSQALCLQGSWEDVCAHCGQRQLHADLCLFSK
jgi:hypothetical protein